MLANIFEWNGRLLLERVSLKQVFIESGRVKIRSGTPPKIDGVVLTIASVNSGRELMIRLSPRRVSQ